MKLEELVNDWRTIDKRQNELLKEIDSELDFHDGGLATPSETARSIKDFIKEIERLEYQKVRLGGMIEASEDREVKE
jgi:hypothetical protein